jgi:single-strand DNA-binding protein
MSNTFNKIICIARLGQDPEQRFTASGNAVTTFSAATDNSFIKDGERKVETEWLSIITWNKTAELCNKYLHKSSLVYVEGRLQTRTWDGQDGQKHYKTEVIASRVIFLDPKQTPTTNGDGEPVVNGDLEPQDIPF